MTIEQQNSLYAEAKAIQWELNKITHYQPIHARQILLDAIHQIHILADQIRSLDVEKGEDKQNEKL